MKLTEVLEANIDERHRESARDALNTYLLSLKRDVMSDVESKLRFDQDFKWAIDNFNSDEGWDLAINSSKEGVRVWKSRNIKEENVVRVKCRLKISLDEFVARIRDDFLFELLESTQEVNVFSNRHGTRTKSDR